MDVSNLSATGHDANQVACYRPDKPWLLLFLRFIAHHTRFYSETVFFTLKTGRRDPSTKLWHSCWSRWHKQLCQFWIWSAPGFSFCEGTNMGICYTYRVPKTCMRPSKVTMWCAKVRIVIDIRMLWLRWFIDLYSMQISYMHDSSGYQNINLKNNSTNLCLWLTNDQILNRNYHSRFGTVPKLLLPGPTAYCRKQRLRI